MPWIRTDTNQLINLDHVKMFYISHTVYKGQCFVSCSFIGSADLRKQDYDIKHCANYEEAKQFIDNLWKAFKINEEVTKQST